MPNRQEQARDASRLGRGADGGWHRAAGVAPAQHFVTSWGLRPRGIGSAATGHVRASGRGFRLPVTSSFHAPTRTYITGVAVTTAAYRVAAPSPRRTARRRRSGLLPVTPCTRSIRETTAGVPGRQQQAPDASRLWVDPMVVGAGRAGFARAHPSATPSGPEPPRTHPAAPGHAPPFGTPWLPPGYFAVPPARRVVRRPPCRDRRRDAHNYK